MSSILKKFLMALTGLALVGFLIAHLGGNLYLFLGRDHFDGYAKKLEEMGPLLILAEIVLAGLFLTHLFMALKLTGENQTARGAQGYADNSKNQSTPASRWMWITGLFVMMFLVVHIKMFKFGEREKPITAKGEEIIKAFNGEEAAKQFARESGEHGSLYGLVQKEFKRPAVVGFYVVLMLVLGAHLSHGIASAFQSLGVLRPGWLQCLKPWCVALAWLIALGFALLPVCTFFGIGIN
ncbi:MAG: succinate dehydrogenase cytochrome b subunit [Planctomycetes bacterium]|nr:succinate dehydrogenase cytochrome b subunit [Planctomycetota bacterium]